MRANITSEFVELEYAKVLNRTAYLATLLDAAAFWANQTNKPALESVYTAFVNGLDGVGSRILSSKNLKEIIVAGRAYPSSTFANNYQGYLDEILYQEFQHDGSVNGGAGLFARIDEKTESLFQSVMLTASKALAANRVDICQELIATTNAAYMSASAMLVLNDVQNGILSGGKELIFIPDRPRAYESGSLLDFAECDGVTSKYGVRSFIFAYVSADSTTQHGSAASIPGYGAGRFYSCGSQEAYDFISRTVQEWADGLRAR